MFLLVSGRHVGAHVDGSSVYYGALFSMCSLQSMEILMKAIGNNRNISPEYPTNQSCGVSSNANRSNFETKKLM